MPVAHKQLTKTPRLAPFRPCNQHSQAAEDNALLTTTDACNIAAYPDNNTELVLGLLLSIPLAKPAEDG